MATADGGGLFGWLVNEDWQAPAPHQPQSALPKVSAQFRHLPATRAQPDVVRLRAGASAGAAGAWQRVADHPVCAHSHGGGVGADAVTANAGASVHHAILLWPFPNGDRGFLRRRVAKAGPRRNSLRGRGTGGDDGFRGSGNNEYYALMLRNGGTLNWTEPFSSSRLYEGVPSNGIFCTDWGILDSLRLLNRAGCRSMSARTHRQARVEPGRPATTSSASFPSRATSSSAHTRDYEFFPV